MLEQSEHESLSRTPYDVKARDRVSGLLQPALGPVEHREKGYAVLVEPASDHVERLSDVSFRPPARPDIVLPKFAVRDPISKREIDAVFDARALLLGRAHDEDAAKRHAREPAETLFARSLDHDNAFVVIEQFERRRDSRKPAPDYNNVSFVVEIGHAGSLNAGRCAKRRADLEVEHQVGKIIQISRLAIQDHKTRPVLFCNRRKPGGGIDDKR